MTVAELAGRLPAIGVVRRWSQSLAVLDAIMSAKWEYRCFSFDSEFGPGQVLASMRNGEGDEYSITITGDGAFVRGFDHESPLSPFVHPRPVLWPGLLTGLPAALDAVAMEPAFSQAGVPAATVALWRLTGDERWHHGPVDYPQGWERQHADPDGSDWLFAQLDGRVDSYLAHASEYFERELPADAVAAVLEHHPITAELLRTLNPERVLHDLADDLRQIGYPAK